MKRIGEGQAYLKHRKLDILVTVLCWVVAVTGFIVPFFFFTRPRETLCVTLSFLFLLVFGYAGIAFLVFAHQNKLRLTLLKEWAQEDSETSVEGKVISIRKYSLRREVPSLEITLEHGSYFYCLLFGAPDISVGDTVRFLANHERIIVGYEEKHDETK